MTELTPDEILDGLRALVTRAECDARDAADPVPQAAFGPPAPSRAPHMPPAAKRPGHLRPVTAANAVRTPIPRVGRG